jgi:nucleoside-diphosphate-sugar epimerase
MSKPIRIAITGANGFLGRAFVKLAMEQGHTVVPLVRSQSSADALRGPGIEPVVVEFASRSSSVSEALAGCDVVVHSAGGGRMRRVRDIYDANVGTTDIVSAAAAQRDIRMVLVSSVAAQGPGGTPARPSTRSDTPRPASHYGRSKLQAEELVAERNGDRSISLRLPALYGPGDDRLLPLFVGASKGWMPTVKPAGITGLLEISDAASLVLNACLSDEHGAFLADDGAPLTRRQLCLDIATAVGTAYPPRIVALPASVLWLAGALNEARARLTNRQVLLTTDKARDLRHIDWVFDCSDTHDRLGWQPLVKRADGLRATAEDYRRSGLI